MKKTWKALFMLGLVVSPFIFASCDKDEGTVSYKDVDDDDWKKKAVLCEPNDAASTTNDIQVNEL